MKRSKDFTFAKRGQRRLSVFLVRQMLFDYVQDRLDEKRKKDVESYLDEHLELQRDLEFLNKSIEFCQNIHSKEYNLFPEIKYQKSFSLKFFFKRMPTRQSLWQRKLRIISFSVVFLLVLFSVDIRKFWNTGGMLLEKEIFEIEKLQEEGFRLDDFDTDPVFKDVDLTQYKREPKKTEVSSAELAKTQDNTISQEKAPVKKTVKTESLAQNQDGQLQGLIHRMFMRDKRAGEYYQSIVDEIVRLGGSKAGKVKLGWERKNGYYYHFTLPEEHKEGFIRFLQEKSSVKVESYPHKRVMDEGVFRFILWLRKD